MFFTTVANHLRTYQVSFYYSLVKYSTACIEPRTYVLTLCSDDANKEKKNLIFWHIWSREEKELNTSVIVKSSPFLKKKAKHLRSIFQQLMVKCLQIQSLNVLSGADWLHCHMHRILKDFLVFAEAANHRYLHLKPSWGDGGSTWGV